MGFAITKSVLMSCYLFVRNTVRINLPLKCYHTLSGFHTHMKSLSYFDNIYIVQIAFIHSSTFWWSFLCHQVCFYLIRFTYNGETYTIMINFYKYLLYFSLSIFGEMLLSFIHITFIKPASLLTLSRSGVLINDKVLGGASGPESP